MIARWSPWTVWSECKFFRINQNVKISQVCFLNLKKTSQIRLEAFGFSKTPIKRTRSCECDNCTIYCTGKSFERKICGYKNECELGNEENCLNLSPTLETPTPPPEPTPPAPSTPDSSDPSEMYSCWTEHLEKMIGSAYSVVYENGTQIPNMKKKEAMRECDILGFRI